MLCPNCHTVVQDERKVCYRCGASLTQSSEQMYGGSFEYIKDKMEDDQKHKRNWTIGLVVLVIGIILIPVVIFTYDLTIGWVTCPAAIICIGVGAIVMLTNRNK